jgi:hypothetical protein
MSLIDDALKRARDQQLPAAPAQDAKSGRPVDPWAYAPLPHVRRRSGARPWAIAGSVAVIAAAVAAIWISRSGRPPVTAAKTAVAALPAAVFSERSSAPLAPAFPAAATPAPAILRDSGSASPSAEPRKAAPPRKTKEPPDRQERDRKPASDRAVPGNPVSTTVLNPGSQTPAREAEAKSDPPPQLPRPANRAVDGRTYVGALVAPSGARIELGGIVYSETNASALLNGRILPVGAVVEGMTISAIHEDRVELSGEGLTVHLTLR